MSAHSDFCRCLVIPVTQEPSRLLIQRHTHYLLHLEEAFLVGADTSTLQGVIMTQKVSDLGLNPSPRSSLGPLALQTYIEQAQ